MLSAPLRMNQLTKSTCNYEIPTLWEEQGIRGKLDRHVPAVMELKIMVGEKAMNAGTKTKNNKL